MPDEKLNIKVYLDTCILSNLRADKIKEEQLTALDKISDYENIVFVTSDKMLDEFLKTTEDRIRITLKILYKLITKIPSKPFIRIEGGLRFPLKFPMSFGEQVEDKLFSSLKVIFPHKDDVEHIYQATNGGCKYFMTLDEDSILKKAKKFLVELNKICPNLEFVDPVILLKKLLDSPL
jgi:hypothetical protein